MSLSFVSGAVYSLELGLNFLKIIILRTLFSSLSLTLLIFTTPMDDILISLKRVPF
ncbi:hypothetical protein PL321_05000 [Caloramator sp. mosi_1]|uniref:hypothetical protein n=1 Tax=Caloramator sp. mosi_1 TaxID=3023090 RepID=UPI0023614639|nr:hypothetical protein [Caloramator sp. mosi_1]WDC84925.1 hypothetical protein PL321_05000 [Caloramator sp. mosi_1]